MAVQETAREKLKVVLTTVSLDLEVASWLGSVWLVRQLLPEFWLLYVHLVSSASLMVLGQGRLKITDNSSRSSFCYGIRFFVFSLSLSPIPCTLSFHHQKPLEASALPSASNVEKTDNLKKKPQFKKSSESCSDFDSVIFQDIAGYNRGKHLAE